ncbi:MAG: hypothetical protein JSW33_04445, partial [bacterium]
HVNHVTLKPYGKIDFSDLNEASALVKSRMWNDVFWTLNDSGDEARIFPINSHGEILKPEWMENYRGIQIPDAVNVDWEAIATDDAGNLIIGDCGNNSNARRDLALYIIKEPYPWETVITRIFKKIQYYYPEQQEFPASQRNYDAEALFWADHYIYLLTKHRSDSKTRLYRIDPFQNGLEIPATLMEEFDIQGRVTAADIDPDGKLLLVLTETSLWLFQKDVPSGKFFKGKTYWLPIEIPGGEAVAFDGNSIILLNEAGELFKLDKEDLYLLN